jgi:hypothetical protein
VLLPIEGATGVLSRVLGTPPWFAPMLGWREMAAAIDGYKPAVVLCESGQSAVEYAFYGRSTPRVYTADSIWNRQMGVQELFANLKLNAAHLPPRARSVIAVGGPYATPEQLRRWDETLRCHFVSVTPLPDLKIRRDRRTIKTFVLRRCEQLREPFFSSP